MPRGSVVSKKRPSEDGTPTQSKTKANPSTPSTGGPSPSLTQHTQPNGSHTDPSTYDMHNGRPIQPYTKQPNIAPTIQYRTPQSQQHQPQTQPPIDPNLFGYAEATDNMAYAYSTAERPPLFQLPSLEQIANEVLDMNGRSYEDYQDSGFISQDQQELHANGFEYHHHGSVSMSNGQTANESNRPDESVDSAISLPGSEGAEQNEKQSQEASVMDPAIADQSFQQPLPKSADADTIAVAGPAFKGIPDENDASTSRPSIEDPTSLSQTSPAAQRDKLNSLPLYRPPAPLSQSPEQTKRQPLMGNGVSLDTALISQASTKRKRDSMSETTEAKNAKRTKVFASADGN